jgi:hypothetical protein
MQALVVAARLARGDLAAGLEVDLPVIAAANLADEEVELPAPSAARARDDGVALERPAGGGRRGLRERQRLVRRAVRADGQVRAAVRALDGAARDVEVLAACLGAHDRDRSYFVRKESW